ncbi:hypothetical protein Cni_G14482 [Canna indica]|uniref:40S ribosomal protein S17 n=1 Tax=Canna indica TaxID=4628 RepID=A0AAQ3QAQ2_9LILI|nr:hypothetical protein Cni_G14482 [Canna indica]
MPSAAIHGFNKDLIQQPAYEQAQPQADISLVSLDYADTSITWKVLYPEWIDEEEENNVPACPSLPEPQVDKGAKFNLSSSSYPVIDPAAGPGMWRGYICSSQQYKQVHVLFVTECLPIPNLFTCKHLVRHEGNLWLYKPESSTLQEKLQLPLGSCKLAIPFKAKGSVRDLVILVDETISDRDRSGLEAAGWKAKRDAYNEWNYNKFWLWQLTDYDNIIFIDADPLVLRNRLPLHHVGDKRDREQCHALQLWRDGHQALELHLPAADGPPRGVYLLQRRRQISIKFVSSSSSLPLPPFQQRKAGAARRSKALVPTPTNGEAESATAVSVKMGRVRTKTVKKSSRQVIERYYSRMTLDFHTNKKILEEVAIIPSKRLRNKIAGFSTHLMRRIQRGPVRGISLKLQEEERERRMDFVPDESAIKVEHIEVDKETFEMLASLGMVDLPGVEKQADAPAVPTYPSRPGGYSRRN